MTRARPPLVLAGVAAFAVVLLAWGALPGLVADPVDQTLVEGLARCLADQGVSSLWTSCQAIAAPSGAPVIAGGPFVLVTTLLTALPLVGTYAAFVLTAAAFLLVALVGGAALGRRLGAGPWTALALAAGYLLAPTTLGLIGFGSTPYGFALLPALAWVDLRAADRLLAAGATRGSVVGAVAALVAIRTWSLFLDGYSGFASLLLGACLLGALVLERRPAPRRVAGLAVAWIGAVAVAAGLYALYTPDVFGADPIAVFRAQSLDVISLVRPGYDFWAWDGSPFALDVARLWGDGSNVAHNYLGLGCVVLAAFGLARARREPLVLGLALAGLVALVLSLGPTLKLDAIRPLGASDVDAPASIGTTLPWGTLLHDVPGLSSLRAGYRWSEVTRLALVVLAALGAAGLVRRGGRARWVAIALAVVAVVELAPDLPASTARYGDRREATVAFRTDVASPLARALRPGERVFSLSPTLNDFEAGYLYATARVRGYNAGPDKTSGFAQGQWPAAVKPLAARDGGGADAVVAALRSGAVDAVVLPRFGLQEAARSWPPTVAQAAERDAVNAPILADPRLAVDRSTWFAVVRLAG